MTTPSTNTISNADVSGPATQKALGRVKFLVGLYNAISVLSLIAIALLRKHNDNVNYSSVWTHGIIVAASALLALSITIRAARGARRAFLRLRIISAVLVVAIVAIIVIPGSFPVWMKAEQGVCGLLVIGVALIVNGRDLRSRFSAK
jgi:hypothetical protein